MKTDKELGEIGRKRAYGVQTRISGNELTSMDPRNVSDEPARTAFAAAVREAIFEGVEGVPSVDEMEQAFCSHRGNSTEAFGIVRNLMLSAFAKQLEALKRTNLNYTNAIDSLRTELDQMATSRNAHRLAEENLNAKLAAAKKRLGELEWRPVSVKPTREDAMPNGSIVVRTRGIMGIRRFDDLIDVEEWLPSSPPTPTAEEIERTAFTKAFRAEFPDASLPIEELFFRIWKARASQQTQPS